MIYDFKCIDCNKVFEKNVPARQNSVECPYCKGKAKKMFHATSNMFIPAHFHTSKSDVFSYEEWNKLKKDPNVVRAK